LRGCYLFTALTAAVVVVFWCKFSSAPAPPPVPAGPLDAHREPSFGIDSPIGVVEPHNERPKDPPAPAYVLSARSRQLPAQMTVGPFTSVQVNVDGGGFDIVGDAANEPSIAVDPLDAYRIAIAWRQFDSVTSNYKHAGIAYSHDGGATWTAGVVDPDTFRTDPILAADAQGNFYYSSLACLDFPSCSNIRVHVFKSSDGGVTWPVETDAYGGDKQWFAVDDRPSGQGAGHIYQFWTATLSCCPPNNFTRSVDGGLSFESPSALPSPGAKWGTVAVAGDGTLYLAGATANTVEHVVMRSDLARNPSFSPIFGVVQTVDLGGYSVGLPGAASPNPVGLLGQVWIATHPSDPHEVYVLASVRPDDGDPLDLFFVRSTDGGQSWSSPVPVSDNSGDGTWQWFGMMSVAPDGRIDAIWNDTRDNPDEVNLSALYYAHSFDGGETWSASAPITPVFNSHIGFPQEGKLGDYNHMVSDPEGVDVAFAATFNGGQDIYYLRIPAPSPEPLDLLPEPEGLAKNRFISWLIPQSEWPQQAAIRIRLTSLHHPDSPDDAQDFSEMEGQFRYVRLFRDSSDVEVFSCPDSAAFGTTFRCATVGCEPEYRDWFAEFGGEVLHVTGTAILPSSIYDVALVPPACAGLEDACVEASVGLQIEAAQWGDVDPGTLNVLDISAQVDKVVDLPQAGIEPQSLLQDNDPQPVTTAVNVLDVAYAVDALKGLRYPFAGPGPCP